MKVVRYARPILGEEEKRAVVEVIESGMIASGPRVAEFERQFASYIGVRNAVATINGTAALHVALLSAGIGRSDVVVTTPYTFIASTNSVLFCGAKPAFADIDYATFNIDPESVRQAVDDNPRAKAILVVHLYGLACDMDPIMDIAREKGLVVVEDCAQSHGAEYRGKRVGSIGHIGIFSFYPTKNMTTGEGGMVVTDDDEMASRVRKLINHGRSGQYLHDELGFNYRMTDMAAAIGICQLAKLEEFNERRRSNARILSELLSDVPEVVTPVEPAGRRHVFHQYTIRAERRDELKRYLDANGVQSAIVYPLSQHRQPLYVSKGYSGLELQVAERTAGEVLSLPIHPGLERDDLEIVSERIHEFYGRSGAMGDAEAGR